MFQGNGKLIGTLKGGPYKACNQDVFVIDHYGKFWVSYPNKVVKNTMNPENDRWTDIVGMPERKITCYPNLNLPGVTGVSGEYVPAFQHQSENAITLQAINNINTNAPINIYDSADYRFRAGNTIILDNGFDARPGSTFIAEIGGCQTGVYQKKPDPNAEIINALSQITVPKKKDFDASKYVQGSLIESGTGLLANIYPNPNNGQFAVKLSKAGDYTLRISDMLGKLIHTSQISNTTEFKIQLSGYTTGNYLVQISSSSEQFVGKVVITE